MITRSQESKCGSTPAQGKATGAESSSGNCLNCHLKISQEEEKVSGYHSKPNTAFPGKKKSKERR
jgi:hypothetical protein